VGGAILALFIALFFLLRLLLQSVVYLGRLGEDEDGEEVEVIDAVTCKRCRQPWRVRLYAKVLSITSSSSAIKISAVLVATERTLKAH
jgi:hypothetical protein